MKETVIDISELRQDDQNFNLGTYEGTRLIQKSFERFGAGRSVLLDRNNNLIAGNKSAEIAAKSGIRKVRVIETDGNTLVVVKRKDIHLDTKEGRELALADNATSALNLAYDIENLQQAVLEFDDFDPEEWGFDREDLGKDIDSQGEIDIDAFEEEQELKVKLTCKQYEQVTGILKAHNPDNMAEALLEILGYYEQQDKQ